MRNDFCSNYLEHSAKGKTWANHRYIAKVKLPSGKMFYFYDNAKYQAYLKNQAKRSAASTGKFTDKTTQEAMRKTSSKSLSNYSSKSVEEKKAVTKSYIESGKAAASSAASKASSETIATGKTKMQELLERANAKAGTSSSKSKGSSSSSSKSKSSSSKSKGSSSKSSKSSSSSKSKDATSKSTKAAKETTAKTAKTTTKSDGKYKAEERAFTQESLKKLYGVKDKDINKHESTEKLLSTLKSYKDGSFGYVMAGGTTYKWTKQGGNIVFKDFKTDKEVTLSSALKNIEEFRTDKKNKK